MIAMPAEIHIRAFDDADTDAVLALWRDAFPEYNAPDKPHREPRRSIANKVAMRDGLFFVAVRDRKIAGTVMAGYDGHRGWLYYLASAPDRRGEGIARTLVTEAEERLLAMGCPKVQLMVRPENGVAQGFYDSLGYEPFETWNTGKRLIAD